MRLKYLTTALLTFSGTAAVALAASVGPTIKAEALEPEIRLEQPAGTGLMITTSWADDSCRERVDAATGRVSSCRASERFRQSLYAKP